MNKALYTLKYMSTYLFIGLGIGSYFPILSSYLEKNLQVNTSQIGLLFALITILPILTLPVWGILTDAIKSPKKTLLLSLIFSIVLMFLLTFIKVFWLFLLVIIIFMLFRSPLMTLYDRMLVNACKIRNLNYGTIRMGGSLGFSVAPFIGMYLGNFFQPQIIFILSSSFFFLVWLIVLFTEDVKYHETEKITIKEDLGVVLKNKNYLYIILIMAIVYGVNDTNLPFMGSYLKKISSTDQYISLAVFLSVIIEVPMLYLSRFVYRILTVKQILYFVNYINIFRYTLYFLFPHHITILILTPIHGLAYGISYPLIIEYIASNVKRKVLATAYTIFAAITSLSIAIISFFSGLLMDLFSDNIQYIFIVFLSIHLLNVFLIVILIGRKNISIQNQILELN